MLTAVLGCPPLPQAELKLNLTIQLTSIHLFDWNFQMLVTTRSAHSYTSTLKQRSETVPGTTEASADTALPVDTDTFDASSVSTTCPAFVLPETHVQTLTRGSSCPWRRSLKAARWCSLAISAGKHFFFLYFSHRNAFDTRTHFWRSNLPTWSFKGSQV